MELRTRLPAALLRLCGGKAALGLGLAAAFLLCLGPVSNPDLPWHLAAGRQIVSTRSVPRRDFLSWTKAGEPWIDFEWATQALYYGLDRAGGQAALWSFKAAGFFGLALILVALLRLWGLPDLWSGLAAPVFMASLLGTVDVRPEFFSFLFFMLQLYTLERRRLGRLRAQNAPVLAAHASAYALWANLHPGFPTGLALCVLYGVEELFHPKDGAEGFTPLSWAAFGLLGTLLNPWGAGLYEVFWDHWIHRRLLSSLVVEWGRPDFYNMFQRAYWVLVAFSFLGFLTAVARRVSLPLEHLLATAVFGLFSARAFRTTTYATLLLFPLSLSYWHAQSCPAWWRRARPWILAVLLIVVGWQSVRICLHVGFLRAFKLADEPVRATEFLRSEKEALSGLRLYNTYNWGGYLDYALYPDYRVYMDGRYLFAETLAETAIQGPVRWKKFIDERGIELALLVNDGLMTGFRNILPARPFSAYAMPSAEWALVYWDSQAMVLVRRSKAPPVWLKRHEYLYLYPHDLRHLGLRVEAGIVSIKDVEEEMSRYRREIHDMYQDILMAHWLLAFKKGLAQSGAQAGMSAAR